MSVRFQSASLTSVTTSAVCPVNFRETNTSPVTCLFTATNTPSLTASVEVTLDDPFSGTPTWVAATNGSALTATTLVVIGYAVRAVRLNVTAWTSGNAQLTVLQGDVG